MTHPRRSLIISWAERAALFVLVLYLCVHTMPRAWNSLVTDFPNYYLAAQLAHRDFDTSRMYEWQWLEREKDHRAIPVRIIGLAPITPFSTLFMWPLTPLRPLAAKRAWILFSLTLLVPIGFLLRSMTGLSYQRIALTFALSFPLHRNFEFGQFYVFLLLLIVGACWAYLQGRHATAGALIAIAAAAKIFPALFFVFFLQRRSWRALASGALTLGAATVLSVAVFGWNAHRTYLQEILPWTLHGEAMPPYITNASISGILHALFLSEPQWNPNPWHSSVLAFSLLLPLLSMLLLAPAILLIRAEDCSQRRIMLEWSALLTASLAVSTIPASYNFVLMALPMCVLCAILLERKRYGWLATLLIAYIGIGFPMPSPTNVRGLAILLYTPRLSLIIAMLLGIYWMLWHKPSAKAPLPDWTRWAWFAAMILSVLFTAHSTFLRERAVRHEYAYRLSIEAQGYLNASPQSDGAITRYLAFTLNGYQLLATNPNGTLQNILADSAADDLSFTNRFGPLLVERVQSPHSQIIDIDDPSLRPIDDARDPMLSAGGRSLAFIRDDHGRGRLMLRSTPYSRDPADIALTPPSQNVYEASFLSQANYAYAASTNGRAPQIYLADATHAGVLPALGESRYPALSPDGVWLAYSHFEHGVWNLWIRDEKTGATRRIGDVPCNQIQPSWESNAKTLLYSTDCGRSLWFTAIARRKVIP